ncbi:hypothetical protein ABW20_dc0110016 [Dactylellina cionopaga]|nr:hypothetical protein ABW20_dc0110016 [Dactylellina cionopaga]
MQAFFRRPKKAKIPKPEWILAPEPEPTFSYSNDGASFFSTRPPSYNSVDRLLDDNTSASYHDTLLISTEIENWAASRQRDSYTKGELPNNSQIAGNLKHLYNFTLAIYQAGKSSASSPSSYSPEAVGKDDDIVKDIIATALKKLNNTDDSSKPPQKPAHHYQSTFKPDKSQLHRKLPEDSKHNINRAWFQPLSETRGYDDSDSSKPYQDRYREEYGDTRIGRDREPRSSH